ncbi:hypothetical protein CEXT_77791 [Caerostris extrusa]|uniref:Uncharacterized protein n=1 Tax=Caerostris extrusa TaxID=172846 RepID=A0AAV4U5G6_CAEEX|nr:hypothetical protein CEXT_77791 [Caerostris extrusa]
MRLGGQRAGLLMGEKKKKKKKNPNLKPCQQVRSKVTPKISRIIREFENPSIVFKKKILAVTPLWSRCCSWGCSFHNALVTVVLPSGHLWATVAPASMSSHWTRVFNYCDVAASDWLLESQKRCRIRLLRRSRSRVQCPLQEREEEQEQEGMSSEEGGGSAVHHAAQVVPRDVGDGLTLRRGGESQRVSRGMFTTLDFWSLTRSRNQAMRQSHVKGFSANEKKGGR